MQPSTSAKIHNALVEVRDQFNKIESTMTEHDGLCVLQMISDTRRYLFTQGEPDALRPATPDDVGRPSPSNDVPQRRAELPDLLLPATEFKQRLDEFVKLQVKR